VTTITKCPNSRADGERVHSTSESRAPVWPRTGDRMVRAGLIEKIMLNDPSKLRHRALEDRTLDDAELIAVTGGSAAPHQPIQTVSESIPLNYEKIELTYSRGAA
jgi:hypothetical protein